MIARLLAFMAVTFSAITAMPQALTDIEFDDTSSTELHVVNPATNSRSLTIDLHGPDGTLIGTYTGRVDAKSMLVGRIEDLLDRKSTRLNSSH